MIKAKEFLDFLCEELDYRFYAGVLCPGLAPLYKYMKPDNLHYMPAANERIALSMALGTSLGGTKSVVLMDAKHLLELINITNYYQNYAIPVMIIGADAPTGLNKGVDYKSYLKKMDNAISKGAIKFVGLEEGFIK